MIRWLAAQRTSSSGYNVGLSPGWMCGVLFETISQMSTVSCLLALRVVAIASRISIGMKSPVFGRRNDALIDHHP